VRVDGAGGTWAVGRPLRFGRSRACELALPTEDRSVPNLLGCVHYLEGEPAVTNLHRRASFELRAGRVTQLVAPNVSVRLRQRTSTVTVRTADGPVRLAVVLDDADLRPARPAALGALGSPTLVPVLGHVELKEGHLRDLAALYEPTLRSGDHRVIRTASWAAAARRVGDTPDNLKGRVLRTIAERARQAGCPPVVGSDSRQVLGRWLLDNRVLTVDAVALLDRDR
jgi:hypothetical protein